MVVHVCCYVELVGRKRASAEIIDAERAYAAMFVWSGCNMVLHVCCYMELVSGRGLQEGL